MKRILIAATVAAVLLVAPVAAWAAYSSSGQGHGTAAATAVAAQAAPTVVRNGSTAVVSWPGGALSSGQTASGYVVRRTFGASTTTVCTTQSPTRTCTDSSPVAGTSTYQVANVFSSWTGAFGAATTFVYDVTAPSTTVTSNPAPNAAGWNKAAPTLTLSAVDNVAVASVTYSIGGATPVTVAGSSATIQSSSLGTTTVTYYATDTSGNVESTKSYTVKVDPAAPSLTVDDPTQAATYSLRNQARADSWAHACSDNPGTCGTASDSDSGLAAVTFTLGNGSKCWNGMDFVTVTTCASVTAPVTNGAWAGSIPFAKMIAGSFTLTVKATDNVGNVTTVTRTFSVTS